VSRVTCKFPTESNEDRVHRLFTPAYVDTAEVLTWAAGLDNQVSFICSEIAALDRTDFDAAYTMHVQMNVADKKTFFAEIARRLPPGARFAAFEVCLTPAQNETATGMGCGALSSPERRWS
jgi:hypothetical protein